jgi:DnaJ-class molecular chaperone
MKQSSRDPYAILGIALHASEKEIRKRYRKLCKQFHPDLNEGDAHAAEIFRDVKWAYDSIVSTAGRYGNHFAVSESSSVDQHADSSHPFFGFFNAMRAYCMTIKPSEEQ